MNFSEAIRAAVQSGYVVKRAEFFRLSGCFVAFDAGEHLVFVNGDLETKVFRPCLIDMMSDDWNALPINLAAIALSEDYAGKDLTSLKDQFWIACVGIDQLLNSKWLHKGFVGTGDFKDLLTEFTRCSAEARHAVIMAILDDGPEMNHFENVVKTIRDDQEVKKWLQN